MCALFSARSLPAASPPFLHSLVEVRRGRDAVLASAGLLDELADKCGQPGATGDLSYFLTKPGVLQRMPVLLLIRRQDGGTQAQAGPEELLGALLLYEYHVSGFKTGLYSSNDRSGRSTLIAPAALRAEVAWSAARHLLNQKAQLVMFSFREEALESISLSEPAALAGSNSVWATRRREIPDFLPLAATYEGTLASIGQRTRSNLRYYRRRLEREVGSTFLPDLEISQADLLAFNRVCMYAVPEKTVGWRLATMGALHDPILMGLKDREGQLLSVLGGRRGASSSEILWQLNREGLRHLSLSLVMRGYFIEHEIGRGSKRFYIEGGTPHPIRESFTRTEVSDLAVLRRSPTAALIRKVARHAFEEENALASMLFDPTLAWHRTRPGAKAATDSAPGAPLSTADSK